MNEDDEFIYCETTPEEPPKRHFTATTKYVSFETHLHPAESNDWDDDDDLDTRYQVELMRKVDKTVQSRSVSTVSAPTDQMLDSLRSRSASTVSAPYESSSDGLPCRLAGSMVMPDDRSDETVRCRSFSVHQAPLIVRHPTPISRSFQDLPRSSEGITGSSNPHCLLGYGDPAGSPQDFYKSGISVDSSEEPFRSREDMRSSENIIREDLREDDISEVSNSNIEIMQDEDLKSDSEENSSLPLDDDSDDINIEDTIFEKELREFSKQMRLNCTKDGDRKEMDYLTTFFATTKLISILGAEEGDSYSHRLTKVLKRLKDFNKERRDGTWTISLKEKKSCGELVLDTVNNLVNGNVKDGMAAAEESKRRAEKELQSNSEQIRDKLMAVRCHIFTEAINISYVKGREVVLPPYLLSGDQRERIVDEVLKKISQFENMLSHRNKMETLKKKGYKSKTQTAGSMLDSLYRSVYPIISECSGFNSPYTFLQRHCRLDIGVDTGCLPEREESAVPVPLGKYLIRNLWTQDADDERVVDFMPVYAFLWKQKSAFFIRTKTTLFEIPYSNTKGSNVSMSIMFDDEYDIYQLHLPSVEQSFEGKMSTVGCTRRNLMEEAQGGFMDTEAYAEISRFGLFYLECVFGFRLDVRDEEDRTLLHYAAWIGKHEVVHIILSVMDRLAICKDEYGETPLMLAVKGGKPCCAAIRLLLHSLPPHYINAGNMYGQTALHLATIGGQDSIIMDLINAGANRSIKDHNGRQAVDLIDSNSTRGKRVAALLRKSSR